MILLIFSIFMQLSTFQFIWHNILNIINIAMKASKHEFNRINKVYATNCAIVTAKVYTVDTHRQVVQTFAFHSSLDSELRTNSLLLWFEKLIIRYLIIRHL